MLELQRFAMNTNTLAGTLEEKLRAAKAAGFGAIVLSGGDLVGHPDGVDVAVELVGDSGLRVGAFQMLHDFEGLSGHMLDYKIDIARSLFDMMRSVGAPILIVDLVGRIERAGYRGDYSFDVVNDDYAHLPAAAVAARGRKAATWLCAQVAVPPD